jgi:trimeric autotransporter adhesin
MLCLLAAGTLSGNVYAQNITTIAGVGIGDDSVCTNAELNSPVAMAFDHRGNAYVADEQNYRIRKISSSYVITTFAGTGFIGRSGDGGPATAAKLGDVYGIAFDSKNNAYISDGRYNLIRKIDSNGVITTVAGTGTAGYNGDNIAATGAQLNNPTDIIVDKSDNVIFCDWQNYRVRKINTTTGIITTVVGDGHGGSHGNHGPATASELGSPFRVVMDDTGNLYVAEVVFQCICKVDTSGILTIITDTTGSFGTGADGDGGPALTATLSSPCGLALDTFNNVYFSDIDNNRIRKIDMSTGIISTYAATGVDGYGGDGGPATSALINIPEGLAYSSDGRLYICDAANNRIRYVDASGTMHTLAGQNMYFNDGIPATNAEILAPTGVVSDAAGNVYIADPQNYRVRKIDPSGIITTFAGNGIGNGNIPFAGDNGPATDATFNYPTALATDAAGNVYIADEQNNRIRKVSTSGIVTTVAGNGSAAYYGDNFAATNASLYYPSGVAVDAAGNIYIADQGNNRIRKVNTSGIIKTFAGIGTYGYSGDGGLAVAAKLYYPVSVAVDATGNVFISDYGNNTIRKVDTSGIISSLTAVGASGFSGDGDSSIYAQVAYPEGLCTDAAGNLFFADQYNNRIRRIGTNGIISTVAGNGTEGFSGDGGDARLAKLNLPSAVGVDNVGNLYIADEINYRVRKVNPTYLSVTTPKVLLDNVQVYPNPTQNTTTVSCANLAGTGAALSVMDMTGREVFHTPLLLNSQSVNMTGLPSGVYLFHITNSAGSKVIKVVKE